MKKNILIKNGIIVTANPQMDILQGDILIEDDTIKTIAPNISSDSGVVFNAEEYLIVPGFV